MCAVHLGVEVPGVRFAGLSSRGHPDGQTQSSRLPVKRGWCGVQQMQESKIVTSWVVRTALGPRACRRGSLGAWRSEPQSAAAYVGGGVKGPAAAAGAAPDRGRGAAAECVRGATLGAATLEVKASGRCRSSSTAGAGRCGVIGWIASGRRGMRISARRWRWGWRRSDVRSARGCGGGRSDHTSVAQRCGRLGLTDVPFAAYACMWEAPNKRLTCD